MTQSKRIGLVGLSAGGSSWASRSHLSYLNSNPNYTITALQNSSKESAEAAAKAWNLPNVSTYGDPESLARDPNVDIIAVSVNVPQHYKLTKPAIEAGKDIFVEWPLAKNLAEAEELYKLAQEKGVKTMVGLQARYNPSVIKAREIVKSGKLGRILQTTMFGHGLLYSPQIPPSYEYTLPVENGANLLTVPFAHAVDGLAYVLGELESVSATLGNLRPELSVIDGDGKELRKAKKTAHDVVSVTGTLVEGGGVVEITYMGGISRTDRNFYWEINGTEGSLLLEAVTFGHIQMYELTVKLILGDGEAKKVEDVQVEKPGEPDKGDHSFNVGKAWDAWAENSEDIVDFKHAVLRHKMVDAIYRSAEKGTKEKYL
ncbi:NAD-binding Rossmann fold oxidoreductase family protein [Periconia macrospinosa]|uniref:NAD-binding Rossmann fold oxidoreductase family protein n=1 Tax=Periconia macrospinosa TaxID=97972 RepID=A0A2V1DGB3_9PLEO|nr:NAD-binding Rossmann fold oxidoreductase family protein [Periconia macrospinosa]